MRAPGLDRDRYEAPMSGFFLMILQAWASSLSDKPSLFSMASIAAARTSVEGAAGAAVVQVAAVPAVGFGTFCCLACNTASDIEPVMFSIAFDKVSPRLHIPWPADMLRVLRRSLPVDAEPLERW